MWSVRSILLILALLMCGGTLVNARVIEVPGSESETCVSQEAANTRGHSTHSKRLRDRHTGEVEHTFTEAQSQRSNFRRCVDDEAPVYQFFRTVSASRPPPLIA
jgi:hypothetical protein